MVFNRGCAEEEEEVSDIADKLRAVQAAWLYYCESPGLQREGLLGDALSALPDPDAVGVFQEVAVWAAGHCTEDGDCLECSRTDDEHDENCMVGLATTALAKLEEKR